MESELLAVIYHHLRLHSHDEAAEVVRKSCKLKTVKPNDSLSQQLPQLQEIYSLWLSSRNKVSDGEEKISSKPTKKRKNDEENTSVAKLQENVSKKKKLKSANTNDIVSNEIKPTITKSKKIRPKENRVGNGTSLPDSSSGSKIKVAPVSILSNKFSAVPPPIKEAENVDTKLGQWKTATLESKERENKFFRLLGGAKTEGAKNKGLFKNLSGASGNVAMAKDQQDTFFKSLETQFESARNIGLTNKGGGLGFQKDPAEGKKFHIDTGSKKSKTFTD